MLADSQQGAANGSCYATYFNLYNKAMGVKAYNTDSLTGLDSTITTASESDLVTTTYDNFARKPASGASKFFPGASGVAGSTKFYTVKLTQNPGGVAYGATSSGDTVPVGGKVEYIAYPNSGYSFVG